MHFGIIIEEMPDYLSDQSDWYFADLITRLYLHLHLHNTGIFFA